ncbi:MAG: T9SS type A sorting domain-containing protein [Bacteroidetes bacterium]|nr:T9SS type A sorting domain-containing protein [Bacteroidota bacterium]
MFRSILHKIVTFILVVIASSYANAQQGTSPVGVNFIQINFDQTPTLLNVNKAPLKYNKDFAFSMQIDDSHISMYTHGLPVFEGGVYNGTTYSGFYYSDGCGNPHSFKMSSSTYVFNSNNENDQDVHDGSFPAHLTWTQLDTLYNHNWGILNHGVNGNANTQSSFINYSIRRNRSHIRRKLYNATDGGVITNVFVNPNGSQPWTDPSFALGNISALNQHETFPIGNNGGDVNAPGVDWTQPYSLLRRTADDIVVPSFVDGLSNSSVGGANFWCPIFTHSLVTQYPFNQFVSDFTYVANTYGIDGLDNILMTTDEEIQDYLIVRDAVTVNYFISGTSLFITYSGEVRDDLRYYTSSLVINSDAVINSININGADDYTLTGIGEINALINLNWDGHYVIPPEQLTDSMVTIAVGSQSQYDCWVAMDYVITLANSAHKDSLRQVLCNIPNKIYDDGFCNCTIDLQQTEVTINIGESITLNGPSGEYDYLWQVVDSIVDSTQTILTSPVDTMQFNIIATNTYGCPAEDSIMVNVHSLIFSLGNDISICFGSCATIEGPPNMNQYNWFVNNTLVGVDQVFEPCPGNATEYVLWAEDQLGASAEDSITVNVNLLPVIEISSNDTTITIGDCIFLSGSTGNYTYQWFIGDSLISSIQSILRCPEDTTQYNLVVTDQYGCSSEDSVLVSVHILNFSLGNDTTICDGNCVTIEGPPGMSQYLWFANNTLINVGQIIEPCPGDTTQFVLWAEDQMGASDEDSISINVLPSPNVVILSNDTTITFGNCIDLFGPSGYYYYMWFIGDSLISTDQDINKCPADTTQYNLVASNIYGCAGMDSVKVNINFLFFDLGPDTTICEGECVTLTGPPDMNYYFWHENGNLYSNNEFITPCPSDTTLYLLLVIDQTGNTAEDSIMINVLPTPVVDLQPADTTIHLGDCVDLIGALGNYSWEWIVADTLFATTQNISPCPLDTTQYNHIATNIYGCSGEDSIIVNIQFLYFDLGPDTTICEGNCVTLSGPPDMVIYNWIVADTTFDTVQTITPCPIDTTLYKLMVEDQYGNTAEDSITINVNPTPIVIFQPADTTIKEKACIELFGAVGNYTWEWIVADTLYATTQDIFPCPEDTTWYKHIATNTYNCFGQDSIVVNIEFLSFDLGPDMTICSEDCVEIAGPDNMADYSWIVADTIFDTVQIIYPCPIETTQYKLVVIDSLGATAEDSIMINTIPKPTVTFENDSIEASFGSDIELSVLVSEDVDLFIWSYDGFDTITFSNNFLLKNVDISTYVYCSVTSTNQCTAIDSIYLTVLDCPEIITSNDTIICVGDSATLTVSGGKFFRWIADNDTISTDSVIVVKPGITSLYIAQTAYELSSCYSSDTVIVMVYDSVLTDISYDTNIVCTNELIELTASGADHYYWTPGGDTNALFSFTILDTTTMYLTGINNNGCHSTDSVTFYTKPAPSVSFTGLFSAYCENDPAVDLVGIPPGGSFSGNGIVGDRFIPAAAGSGVHEVYYSLTNAENCTGRDTVITTVYSSGGSINLGDDFTLQLNESKLLDAGSGFDNYYWTTGETTQTITVVGTAKPTGTYEYAVMGVIHGCSTRGSVTITFVDPDGYDEVHLPNLSIYPNPNLGKFTIKFSSVEKDISINITNIQGNDIYRNQKVSCDKDCKVEIDLVGINSGFYFLQISTPTGLSTAKIIIK